MASPSTGPHAIGIIGFGKIAQDQHAPVIAASAAFELVGITSRGVPPDAPAGARFFGTPAEMYQTLPELAAVAICTPPAVRRALAREALAAGKHVLLEKPPAATLSELADIERAAHDADRVVFATWHSRFAPGVEQAAQVLAGHTVRRLQIDWKEDVRRWHPGQQWIWQAGGFGIFDPGINALSIATRILPEPLFVRQAELWFPAGRDAPVAATLQLSCGRADEDAMRAEFDWRQTGRQIWDIEVDTHQGLSVALRDGGARLEIDGRTVPQAGPAEYQGIYARFDELLRAHRSDLDATPLRLVADAFLLGRRVQVEPFAD